MDTKICKCCGRELPVTMFATSVLGTLNTCKDCVRERQKEGRAKRKSQKDVDAMVEKARLMRLDEFTPRDLMKELKRRGYEFKMKYVEVHEIDSATL